MEPRYTDDNEESSCSHVLGWRTIAGSSSNGGRQSCTGGKASSHIGSNEGAYLNDWRWKEGKDLMKVAAEGLNDLVGEEHPDARIACSVGRM
jgi:hypothetical protein